jgi:hypothetical protein
MPSQKLNLDQPAEAIDAAEARMRLALGLTGSGRPTPSGQSGGTHSHAPQPAGSSHDPSRPQRRRFAQDGDVPVVMLNRGRDTDNGGESRLQTLTAELREERNNRQRAERSLDEANLNIQSLKTKLAHAELAFEDRLRDEREARSKIEALRAADHEARAQAERKEAETALALSMLERRVIELESEAAAAKSALAAATLAAVPKTDLFGEVPQKAPARKTRQAFKVAAEPEPEPELDVEPAPAPRDRKSAATAAPVIKKTEKPVATRGAKKPAAVMEVEEGENDQPIEWWLPSFRASRTAGAARKRKTR